jgi:hypothetical protein
LDDEYWMLWMLLEGLRNEGNRNWYKYGCFWGDWQMNSGGVLKFLGLVPEGLQSQSEPGLTNAPVGHSVNGMGCIFSFRLNQSTFFGF